MMTAPAAPSQSALPYLQGRSISRDEQRAILDQALALAAAAAPRAIVAFDLDSTIFDNRPRQSRILREYGQAHGIPALAASKPEDWTTWSLADAMRAAGCDPPTIAAHHDAARQFWRDRFFTSDYCEFDLPIVGAAAYLAAVIQTGAQIAYVTGRHEQMGPGSIACMRASDFPLPDGARVHLLLKPTFEMSDDGWKLEAFRRLDTLGELVAAFDNEPAHINGYAARYIGALCVRLATDDSGRPIPVAPGVPSIAHFLR